MPALASGRYRSEAGRRSVRPRTGRESGRLHRRRPPQTARRRGGVGVRTGPSRFGLKVRKYFAFGGGLHYCHLPTAQAVVGLVSGKESKKLKRGVLRELKPTQQWCRYPIPNVVPETGVWIIARDASKSPTWVPNRRTSSAGFPLTGPIKTQTSINFFTTSIPAHRSTFKQRFRPLFQILSIALFEDSKVAMAIRR